MGPGRGLVIVGLTTWYLLRPASADALYERIVATTASHTIKSYRQAESDIGEFLMRFPHDPRAAGLREYSREIELDRLETRFELRAEGLLAPSRCCPSRRPIWKRSATPSRTLRGERRSSRRSSICSAPRRRPDPGPAPEKAGPTAQCLELARRRLKQLDEQIDRSTSADLPSIQTRLDQADELAARDPDAARAIRRAVIELYRDKDWAAPAVQRARKALATER